MNEQTPSSSGAIRYEIVTPHSKVDSGECDSLIAPAIHGEIGILKNHSPILCALDTGLIRLKSGAESKHIFIAGGFLEVLGNRAVILAEQAERPDQIDVPRAKKSLDRARARLNELGGTAREGSPVDRNRARRAARRAAFRLKAAGQDPAPLQN